MSLSPPNANPLCLKVKGGIEDSPRAKLLARAVDVFGETMTLLAKELPSPILVTLADSATLPGGNIGCFRIGSRAAPATQWEVRIAYGEDFANARMAEAWVATLPHELLHLRDFFALTGALPCDVDWPNVVPGYSAQSDRDEYDIEQTANGITADYLAPRLRAELGDPALLKGIRKIQKSRAPGRAKAARGR